MEASLNMSNKRKMIIIIIAVILVVITVVVAVVLIVRQPSSDDYKMANGSQLANVESARSELRPAVNKYFAAFKKTYNETDSPDKAAKAAKLQYDAYMRAEARALAAIKSLEENRVSNENQTGTAIKQLKQDYTAEVEYITGLVESYVGYTVLFADDQQQCSGIFVGETSSLADRKKKLDAAAKDCNPALRKLKQSKNLTYVDYAKKVERRVKLLQDYAAVTFKAESNYRDFDLQAAKYQDMVKDANARNASDAELYKLVDEINQLNTKINESQTEFEFASDKYIAIVKEMPTLFEEVYGTQVPAKLKNFEQIYDTRMDILTLILEGKLAAK